jgi:phosphoglycerate kinase
MKTIDQYNFAGKKALIRVDYNVPLDNNFQVTDDTRLQATIPTINKILKDGGSVILMSHLGRPKSGPSEEFSLKHLVKYLDDTFEAEVKFADDCIGEEAQRRPPPSARRNPAAGKPAFYKEEEKGDPAFAQKLAALGDVYVNDAFGTAHRAHASTAVIAQYFTDKVCGYVMQAELDNARKVLEKAERPFTAIMGGAKISDKILIIERLLDRVDNLIIGGGMTYTFIKALGGNIGNSLLEADKVDLARELIDKAKTKGVNLILPPDSVAADGFKNDANSKEVDNKSIPDGWMGLDIGPQARETFARTIENSRTILWNGPMGVFEFPTSPRAPSGWPRPW